MTLAPGSLVLGFDFTSAPTARKPITMAVGRWYPGTPVPEYRLEEVRAIPSLEAFSTAVAAPGPWVGGFDLPFSQPRSLIEHERWPTAWPSFVRDYCSRPREALRATFKRWCDGRPSGDKFAWRRTDKPAGSSPAMRWTNPPVAWMMHAGIVRMLDAGLAFPAHRHGMPGPGAGHAPRFALESYPGFTVRKLCRRPYKSDAPASQNEPRTANRRLVLGGLESASAGLDVLLVLRPGWKRRLVSDPRGDLIDAVICGLQAAHAAALPDFGLPADIDPLEGWIASVPPPASPAGPLQPVERSRGVE